MYLIREIMNCQPGKVRPMVEKFLKMSKLMAKGGQPPARVMTDFAAERYWTIVVEFEVGSLDEFEKMMSPNPPGVSEEDAKEMMELMKDYHALVQQGRREIFRIEG